ncbi:MAG: hypothetical protein ACI9IQ_003100 [Cyclobacteriaceae bacterium]
MSSFEDKWGKINDKWGQDKWGRINGVRVNIQYCIFTLTPFIFPFISIAYFSNSSFSF